MREYVRPMALVEEFVANSYVAACNYSISNNGMNCINPTHSHFGNYEFSNVWVAGVEGADSACKIKVTDDSPRTRTRPLLGNYYPQDNAHVYTASGNVVQCTRYVITRYCAGTYAPVDGNTNDVISECYGSYVDEGNVTGNVLS